MKHFIVALAVDQCSLTIDILFLLKLPKLVNSVLATIVILGYLILTKKQLRTSKYHTYNNNTFNISLDTRKLYFAQIQSRCYHSVESIVNTMTIIWIIFVWWSKIQNDIFLVFLAIDKRSPKVGIIMLGEISN